METNIYKYDDCKLLLADLYQERCRNIPEYSCRKFATDAGFANPGFLNDVIKGRRKLSPDATERMIRVFAMTEIEGEFFRLLVNYGQAKKEEERQAIYKRMIFRRNRSKFARLHPSLVKYYQDYHYPLVRSAIEVCDFRGDYEMLSRFLDPPISTGLTKKYVRDLCDWGLVSQDRDGKYSVTSKMVEPPETLHHLVKEINKEWIKQAHAALRTLPKTKRHISSMLLNIGSETYDKILERIDTFREELFALAEKDANPDRVMLLNLQFFPKSGERSA